MQYLQIPFFLMLAFGFAAQSVAASEEEVEEFVRNSYIFVFSDDMSGSAVAGQARGLTRAEGRRPDFVYKNTIKGFSARMSLEAAMRLVERSNGSIVRIEKDQLVHASPKGDKRGKPGGGGGGEPAGQETPWGITRVGGSSNGNGKTAWIIDTGIDLDHPDLIVGVSRGKDFTGSRKGVDDENGHGTHVAGTIAALGNNFGVIGVAAGATVVPVKVLNRRGSGSISGVTAGVDYVAAPGNGVAGDVANMSLGGGTSTALDNAVLAAASTSGVKFVLAAGNESDDAANHSPARAANGSTVYAVSAIDINDRFAYFSNYCNGPVNYAAPGVSIKSTWKDGGYNTISGTSMAAPHVAGLLLLGIVTADGVAGGDTDPGCGDRSAPDPIATH